MPLSEKVQRYFMFVKRKRISYWPSADEKISFWSFSPTTAGQESKNPAERRGFFVLKWCRWDSTGSTLD